MEILRHLVQLPERITMQLSINLYCAVRYEASNEARG
jgi:hypothetical protein